MQVYSLIKKFGFNIPYVPGPNLGSGADGETFSIIDNENLVIKFSIIYDNIDSDNIDSLLEKRIKIFKSIIDTKPEHLVNIYECDYVGENYRITVGENQRFIIYYYVMDKLNKISEDEKKVFHTILCHEDLNKIKNYSNNKVIKMLRGMSSSLDFNFEKIMLFYEARKISKIKYNDFHVRNIMKDNFGNFKFVDLDRCDL